MNDAELEAYKMTILSEARAKARATEGYTYQDERRFDVLDSAAKNEGGAGGNFINMGVGLGVGVGMGREMGNITKDITSPSEASPKPQTAGRACQGCGAIVPQGAKFCPECGKKQEAARFCPECGNKCTDGVKFCPECGTKLI